jgi:hypothetical protein
MQIEVVKLVRGASRFADTWRSHNRMDLPLASDERQAP